MEKVTRIFDFGTCQKLKLYRVRNFKEEQDRDSHVDSNKLTQSAGFQQAEPDQFSGFQ